MNNSNRALIVDDEPDIRELLEITLGRMAIDTCCAPDLNTAKTLLRDNDFNLCLTDMNLPDGNGIDLVSHIQENYSHLPVAMITAYGSMDTAITALKAGAFDFVSKPIELERLRSLVKTALKLNKDTHNIVGQNEIQLLGNTNIVINLREQISKLARSQAPVFISGESGSGKELAARLIHTNGPRSSEPFIPVNCGAIPSELMESEFFGHKKGSFTGASEDKIGLFQAAEGGTLFLDEVADLPLEMQVKLLRTIQEKAVRSVGSHEEISTDVRILSATHKDLVKEVKEERFRSDLYYRINVIELQVPSLRQRVEDIPLLTHKLLAEIADECHQEVPEIENDALELLMHYTFPGNVRELENILERAFTLCENNTITTNDLNLSSNPAPDMPPVEASLFPPIDIDTNFSSLEEYLETVEKQIISKALEAAKWNKTAAAKSLGISFRALRYRLKKLELE